jgi:hypothetical protein
MPRHYSVTVLCDGNDLASMQVQLPMGDRWVVLPQWLTCKCPRSPGFAPYDHDDFVGRLADLLLASSASAQTAPASPEYPWHGSAEFSMKEDTGRVADSRFAVDQSKTYCLSELIALGNL